MANKPSSTNNSSNSSISVLPSLTREWKDFTDAHRDVRRKAEDAVDQYLNLLKGSATEALPLIIAGGLGSGKTQLLYHLFKYSWRERKIPALYIDLKTLINVVKNNMIANGRTDKLSPKEFLGEVSNIVFKKLEFIRENFNENKYDLVAFWLPELSGQGPRLPPRKLFESIGVNPNDALSAINNSLQLGRGAILLVDEVEMAYKELMDLIGGGFRDLVDYVGRGVAQIYLVLAVGYLSYYELFLSEFSGDIAFARRVKLVQIPPIDPMSLHEWLKPLMLGDKSNTFWWFTRGRLGWLASLEDVVTVNDKVMLLEWHKFPQLKTPIAENLPVFDVDELQRYEDKYCRGDEDCKAALRYLLLNIRPLKVDGLPQFVKSSLTRLSGVLVSCDNLVTVPEIVESFTEDIINFWQSQPLSIKEEDKRLVKVALDDILSALATYDMEGKGICVGAQDNFLLRDTVTRYVDSVLSILMTYIAENYLSNDETRRVNDALYIVYSNALNGETWNFDILFQKVRNLFEKHIGKNYVVVAPWVLQSLIPMYLSNPIISNKPGLDINTLERKLHSILLEEDGNSITNLVDRVSEYIGASSRYKGSDFNIYIIPVPRAQYIDGQVKEKIYSIVEGLLKRHESDIKYSTKKILLFFPGAESSFVNDITERLCRSSPLYDLMIKTVKRIYIGTIPGERLSDFVKSLLVMLHEERSEQGTFTVEGITEKLRPDQKRRVDYFRTTLASWLSEFIEKFNNTSREKLQTNNPDKLKDDLVKDLETLKRFKERTSKFRPHIRAHALLYISIPLTVRKLFNEDMRNVLSPGSLIRISSLPSIYQEFSDTFIAIPLKILDIFPLNSIVSIALEDEKSLPLEEALSTLEKDQLPLYNDFVNVISDLSIDTDKWKDELMLLYKSLLFIKLVNIRKNDILNRFYESSKSAKESVSRLLELLNEIGNVSKGICESSPICVNLRIGARNKSRSLADELEGIRNMLDSLEQLIKDGTSNYSQEDYVLVSFVTLFGLPDERDELLKQVKEEAKEWYEKLYNEVYGRLVDLQLTLEKVKAILKDDNRGEPIELSIESLKSIDGVINNLSEILNKIKKLYEDYSNRINKINELRGDIIKRLNDIKSIVSSLKEEVDKA